MKQCFLLRSLHSSLNGLAPDDKIVFIKQGTLSGGSLSVDVSDEFEDGAILEYVLLKNSSAVSSGAITVTNTAIADTATVDVMIIGKSCDLRQDD